MGDKKRGCPSQATDMPARSGRSRREFLRAAGAAGAATALGPTILVANSEKRNKPVILGKGEHTYELVENWGNMPWGTYGYTHGVAIDSDGLVYIHHQNKGAVMVFDPNGRFIKAWGDDFAGGAHGIDIRKENDEEFFYFCDMGRHLVIKTTHSGKEVWRISYPKESELYEDDKKFVPTNVIFAPDGGFYVADGYGKSYIHQYNANAEYIRSFGGGMGNAPGQLHTAHGIMLDSRGEEPRIMISDRSNSRLESFTLDGRHVGSISGFMKKPCQTVERNGELLVADLFGRVVILDRNNEVITFLGDWEGVEDIKGYPNLPHGDRTPGKFIAPHDICWDSEGNIYVAEWVPDGRISKLRHVS